MQKEACGYPFIGSFLVYFLNQMENNKFVIDYEVKVFDFCQPGQKPAADLVIMKMEEEVHCQGRRRTNADALS